MGTRTVLERGTWIDPEEMAYPSGAINAGRKAKVICADGVLRTAKIGIPDTAFSIPGYVNIKRRSIAGYLYLEDGAAFFMAGGKS